MNLIRQARKSLHLRQHVLANAIGVQPGAISNYERGLRCPDIRRAVAMSRFFAEQGLIVDPSALMLSCKSNTTPFNQGEMI